MNEYSHFTHSGKSDKEKPVYTWKTFSKLWRCCNESSADTPDEYPIEYVFANCSEDDDIYPLTTKEIAEAQKADATLKHAFKRNAVLDKGLEVRLVENTLCVCKEGRLVIPKPLKGRAVMWYHHYLQHP